MKCSAEAHAHSQNVEWWLAETGGRGMESDVSGYGVFAEGGEGRWPEGRIFDSCDGCTTL